MGFRCLLKTLKCVCARPSSKLWSNFSSVSTESPTVPRFLQLCDRSLLRISGADASAFLQGIITNDMKHLESNGTGVKASSIYTLLLNHQGRVLYDAIIYASDPNAKTPSTFLLDCDSSVSADVMRHLNIFRVRKKVAIDLVDEQMKMWVVFPDPKRIEQRQLKGQLSDETTSTSKQADNRQSFGMDISKIIADQTHYDCILLARDPRLEALGWRIIMATGATPEQAITAGDPTSPVTSGETESSYHMLRLKLGVGEGAKDLPPANCFPLECNADYLHGVSFHKGCYIGQELTARTHHTGVVRKRLMPLVVSGSHQPLEPGLTVLDEQGKIVGKIRASKNGFGLGLMRIQECLHSPDGQSISMKITEQSDIRIATFRPYWWPVEIKMNTK